MDCAMGLSVKASCMLQVADDERELVQNEEEAEGIDVKKKKKYLGSIKYKVSYLFFGAFLLILFLFFFLSLLIHLIKVLCPYILLSKVTLLEL